MIAISASIRQAVHGRCPAHRAQLETLERQSAGDAVTYLQAAVQCGYLDREAAGDIAAGAIGRSHVALARTLFQQELVDKVPQDVATKLRLIPLYRMGNVATVAMADPQDDRAASAVAVFLDSKVSPVFSFPDEIESAILVKYHAPADLDRLVTAFDFRPFQNAELTEAKLAELLSSKQLVAMSDALILMALKERASDIHVEPRRRELAVRFRIDGEMVERLVLPANLATPLISRLKIISGMDITERRAPQDGRLAFALPMKSIDIRVSSLPTVHGEKVVMRLLGSLFSGPALNLDRLDLSRDILERVKEVVRQPHGILFVTGPTGSGKTTTLYAALNFINRPGINVVTLEDPVEYEIPGISHVQVNDKAGRGFQAALRSVMRQDPDVILVGEIRDVDTARIASQAAMTGHLVLTTLHTADAIQATTRLIDMGVERFMVAPTLIGVLNQRLVRRICPFCRVEHRPAEAQLAPFFRWSGEGELPPFYRGQGCERCAGSGFYGRVALHEFLCVTREMRDGLLGQLNHDELQAIAARGGYRPMRHDGFMKALRGLTTLEEVVHATPAVRP